jgi:hypothetical protein
LCERDRNRKRERERGRERETHSVVERSGTKGTENYNIK